jgi:hypothetical protein
VFKCVVPLIGLIDTRSPQLDRRLCCTVIFEAIRRPKPRPASAQRHLSCGQSPSARMLAAASVLVVDSSAGGACRVDRVGVRLASRQISAVMSSRERGLYHTRSGGRGVDTVVDGWLCVERLSSVPASPGRPLHPRTVPLAAPPSQATAAMHGVKRDDATTKLSDEEKKAKADKIAKYNAAKTQCLAMVSRAGPITAKHAIPCCECDQRALAVLDSPHPRFLVPSPAQRSPAGLERVCPDDEADRDQSGLLHAVQLPQGDRARHDPEEVSRPDRGTCARGLQRLADLFSLSFLRCYPVPTRRLLSPPWSSISPFAR